MVSKLSHLSKLAHENNTANKTVKADRLDTMFLAMADARAMLIKFADRMHNMMTLEALPPAKQQRFTKETLEIFSLLANRLGISSWKDRLENMCFKYLKPDQHAVLLSKLMKSFDDEMITSSVEKLEQALKDGAVSYHILSGRHKSLYSIYSTMIKKKQMFGRSSHNDKLLLVRALKKRGHVVAVTGEVCYHFPYRFISFFYMRLLI